jgi:hypothetical protein
MYYHVQGGDIVPTIDEFITMSMDLNLFFLRIMKEHSFFLEVAFTPRDSGMGQQAADFRVGFQRLLAEAVELADRNVSRAALGSQQFSTKYTIEAERLTQYYTGVPFDFALTRRESMLTPAQGRTFEALEDEVVLLDQRAYQLTASLAAFKERILANVRSCRMFTLNYPLLIDHIMREAKLYMSMLAALLSGESIMGPGELIDQEIFWNRIMAEHSKFIAGLLDPSEETLIDTARNFGKEFDALTSQAQQATTQAMDIGQVTADSEDAAKRLRDFKAAGTKGLLECKIQSIIIPLLGDHVLREANHYLCILGICDSGF